MPGSTEAPSPSLISAAEYAAILRCDFASFVTRCFYEINPGESLAWNGHLDVLTSTLADVACGKIKRLIITMPPRHLKSICASVALPAWLLGRKPSTKIICASYGKELSEELARHCLSVISSAWYQMVFPTRVSPLRRAVHDFQTTEKGYRRATSVGGPVTGFGADVIIVDDPQKTGEASSDVLRSAANKWFDERLRSRLNRKTEGAIVVAMQRVHEDDLVGHLMDQGGWELVNFPAIAVADEDLHFNSAFGLGRFVRKKGSALHEKLVPLSFLEKERGAIGEDLFSAQYQQDPAPADGKRIKIEWFKRYEDKELPPRFDRVIQSWDTANKDGELNDYNVCTTWGVKDKTFYLRNVFRKRMVFPELERAVHEQAGAFDPETVLIEESASGTNLLQVLKDKDFDRADLVAVKVEGNKIFRMEGQTDKIANGFVYIPREAHWLKDYVSELVAFPHGRHDDQVDSTSQALKWLSDQSRESIVSNYFVQNVQPSWNLTPTRNPTPTWNPLPRGMCRIKPPSSVSHINLRDGSYRTPDTDGLFTVSEEDARPFLGMQWTRVK